MGVTANQAISNRFQNQINRSNWGEQNDTMDKAQRNRLEARDARVENRALTDESKDPSGQLGPTQYANLENRLTNISHSIARYNQGQYPGPLLPGQESSG